MAVSFANWKLALNMLTLSGACYVDKGNRRFTLISNKPSREKNYNIITEALKNLGINAIMHGRNDIVVPQDDQ